MGVWAKLRQQKLAKLIPILLGRGTPRTQLQRLLNDGNTAAWYQPGIEVTGTLTATEWANQLGIAGSLAEVAGSGPIYLPWTGQNYAYYPRVNGNYLSTGDSATNRPTGDLEFVFYIASDAWGIAADRVIILSGNGAAFSSINYEIVLKASNKTIEFTRPDGNTNRTYTSSALTTTDGVGQYIKVQWVQNNGAGNSIGRYWTSPDGVTYTQLGTDILIANTAVGNSDTTGLFIGATNSGIATWNGKIYRVTLANAIGGAPVVDFNPQLSPETTTNGATFVAATGETWTLKNTGATPAQIVGSSQMLFNGTAAYLKTGAFTLNQPETIYLVGQQITWTDADSFVDGNALNSMVLQQHPTTPKLNIYAGTDLSESTGLLALKTNGIMLAQFASGTGLISVNGVTSASGAVGAANGSGLTLGAGGNGTAPANIQVKELIVRNVADSAATQVRIAALLAAAHESPSAPRIFS